MELLKLEDFSACLNETFSVALNGSTAPFVLVEARPLEAGLASRLRTPFALLFRHASPILFPQGTYSVRHGRMGDVGIFMVPVAQDRDGFLYQAVFN